MCTGRLAFLGVARFGGAAVLVEIARHRQAEVTPVAQQRSAGRAGGGLHLAVGLGAAGDVVAAVVAAHAVDVQRELPVAGIGAEQAGLAFGAAVVAALGATAEAVLRRRHRDAAVDHVDHAADGAGAVKQGRRAFQHFDLVGQEGLDRSGVILADVGDILRTQAVFQHRDARAIHAADHRAADRLAQAGGLHAGDRGDCLAQRAGLDLVQRRAGQHGDRGDDLVGLLAQRHGIDGDRVQILGFGLVVVLVRRNIGRGIGGLQRQGGGAQAGGQGEGEHGLAHVGCCSWCIRMRGVDSCSVIK